MLQVRKMPMQGKQGKIGDDEHCFLRLMFSHRFLDFSARTVWIFTHPCLGQESDQCKTCPNQKVKDWGAIRSFHSCSSVREKTSVPIVSDGAFRELNMTLMYITSRCKSASPHQISIASKNPSRQSPLLKFPPKHLSNYLQTI